MVLLLVNVGKDRTWIDWSGNRSAPFTTYFACDSDRPKSRVRVGHQPICSFRFLGKIVWKDSRDQRKCLSAPPPGPPPCFAQLRSLHKTNQPPLTIHLGIVGIDCLLPEPRDLFLLLLLPLVCMEAQISSGHETIKFSCVPWCLVAGSLGNNPIACLFVCCRCFLLPLVSPAWLDLPIKAYWA